MNAAISGMHRQTLRYVRIRLPDLDTLFNCLSRNSELLHFGNQRGPVHPEPGSSAIRSSDNPAGFAKGGPYVSSIRIFQRAYIADLNFRLCEIRNWGSEFAAARKDHRALDEILQFPDITRPIVAFQSLHHLVGNALDRLSLSSGELFNEVFYQQRDIVSAFPQGRQRDRKDIQPVVKI